jgi:hypothetical protein
LQNVEVHTSATGSELPPQTEEKPQAEKLDSKRVADCGETPCCASSFVLGDYKVTLEKTPEAKYKKRRGDMVAEWGTEQERRNRTGLKIIPLETYLIEKGLQKPSA